jgi:hypothetical protein
MAAAVHRLCGHPWTDPTGVAAQSITRIRLAISLSPMNTANDAPQVGRLSSPLTQHHLPPPDQPDIRLA